MCWARRGLAEFPGRHSFGSSLARKRSLECQRFDVDQAELEQVEAGQTPISWSSRRFVKISGSSPLIEITRKTR